VEQRREFLRFCVANEGIFEVMWGKKGIFEVMWSKEKIFLRLYGAKEGFFEVLREFCLPVCL
jgi:hypothetical protein